MKTVIDMSSNEGQMTEKAWTRAIVMIILMIISIGTDKLNARPKLPGFYNEDGSRHEVYYPSAYTGDTVNVLDYGADPEDNDFDDRPAIEDALRNARFGSTVLLPEGTYNLNSNSYSSSTSHIVLKSGIRFLGEGMDHTILISNFDTTTNMNNSTVVLRAVNIFNTSIEKLQIRSTYNGLMPTDGRVSNPDHTAPAYGIYIDDSGDKPSYNIFIDSLKIQKVWRMMIRVANTHDVTITNCEFFNATDLGGGGAGYGISIQGEGWEIDNYGQDNDSRYNYVANCRFIGPHMRHGVVIQYHSHNNWIRKNYFYHSYYDAIDLHGEDEYLNDIDSNTVEYMPTGGGVGVGNTGANHDASGYGNYIHHNTFYSCREGVKVYLGSPDTRIEHNYIRYNTISGAKGIYILNGPGTRILDNVITNNTSGGFTGIYLDYDNGTLGNYFGRPDSVAIARNTITNNANGLVIESGTNIMLGENQIENNQMDVQIDPSVTFAEYTSLRHISSADEFILSNAYPNPFNPNVNFDLFSSGSGEISVKIYDISGRCVDAFYHPFSEGGITTLRWSPPAGLSSGIYFARFEQGEKRKNIKLQYIK